MFRDGDLIKGWLEKGLGGWLTIGERTRLANDKHSFF